MIKISFFVCLTDYTARANAAYLSLLPQKLGLVPLENWASEPRIGGNLKKLGASGETWVRAVLVTLASGELTWGGSWLIGDRLRYQHLSPPIVVTTVI